MMAPEASAQGSDAASQALDIARKRWASAQTQMSGYDLTVNIVCFCSPRGQFVLHVRGGILQGAESLGRSEPVDEATKTRLQRFTVEGLFRQIAEAVGRKSEQIDALYDFSQGYPFAIQMDQNKKVWDDEMQLTATLQAIPRKGTR
jgi:hypothetical protein